MATKENRKAPTRKKNGAPRQSLRPSQEARLMLHNLFVAYLAKRSKDPQYTRVQWAKDAGINNHIVVTRLAQPDGPMLSLDRALRLANALGVGLDDLKKPTEVFLKQTMKTTPQAIADQLLAEAEKTSGFAITKYASKAS